MKLYSVKLMIVVFVARMATMSSAVLTTEQRELLGLSLINRSDGLGVTLFLACSPLMENKAGWV